MSALHVKARGSHPAYPQREPVDDQQVSWKIPWPEYAPADFLHPTVTENDCSKKPGGWADTSIPDRELIEGRGSYELKKQGLAFTYDGVGRPLNPWGRTGMGNRGLLGKWGPNHAADPIITRRNYAKAGKPLEVVAVKRKDTGDWAIPGGMVDPGENVSQTLKREFTEEAGNFEPGTNLNARFEALTAKLLSPENGVVVYSGYVDDPRNTDHAWMETIATHFHCDRELGEMLPLGAGKDELAVKWVEFGSSEHHGMYASHKTLVDLALQRKHFDRQPSRALLPHAGDGASKGDEHASKGLIKDPTGCCCIIS